MVTLLLGLPTAATQDADEQEVCVCVCVCVCVVCVCVANAVRGVRTSKR